MVRFYTYLELYLDDVHKSVSLSEFENYFKVPHQTLKNHLNKLTPVLLEDKRKRFRYYKLKLDNPLTKEYLTLCEKERLITFLERNTLFSRLYVTLSPFFKDASILIFGSSVTSKDFKDIDILILSENKEIKKALKTFEATYAVKLHIIQTLKKDLSISFIKELKQKHIMLNNHDFLMEVLYEY